MEVVRDWAMDQTEDFALGYLDVHRRDGLCYAVLLGLGDWSTAELAQLIEIVAQRADSYEAALVGEDIN